LNILRKSTAHFDTNSLISSRNFEQAGGGFHRTDRSGSRLVAIWESQAKSAAIRCHFLRSATGRVSFTVARIAGAIFLAYARSNAQSPASPVAAHITAASSMLVFDYRS